jgi:glycosyltransferase involved in cell wall biosynthesis
VSDLVVCSLEPWDDVRRRSQFLVEGLLERDSELRVLYVEPACDPVRGILHGHLPTDPRLRRVRDRLWALRPLTPLPLAQVRRAARRLGFAAPTLWVNDPAYAPLAQEWRALYDVTGDRLLACSSGRELERRRRLDEDLLRHAKEVVVCSPRLVESRGRTRRVSLVPNGVDLEHFRRPLPRPSDLPDGPLAVYVGTLQDERIDVPLVEELARHIAVALVGPDSLSIASSRVLRVAGVHILGPRPYAEVPAYLQHADVVIVPHLVTPFTDSLDPIKAYECLAVGTPTIATRVAGFRDLGCVETAPREEFAAAVLRALDRPREAVELDDAAWDARVAAFETLLSA